MASDAFHAALAAVSKKIPTIVKSAEQSTLVKKLQLDSPRLTYAYGGGIKIGVFHRYFGPESGCKSTICTYIGGQFQKHLAEQFPELSDHKYIVYCDVERSFDPEHAKDNGLDLSDDRFILLQPLNIEDLAFSLQKLIETNQVACVILDSESFLATRSISEDEFNKANFGSVAKALKEFCNRFIPLASEYNTTFLVISQERANLQMMSHAIQTTGGYALKYAASTSFRTRKIENLTEGSKIVGIHIHCKNYKNKTAIPFRECEMDLYFKDGFDSNCEFVDFLKDFNEDPRLVPLCYAGNGGTFKSEKFGWSYRGKDNFIEAIKQNQVTGWEEIKQAILDIISHEIDGMENTVDPEQEAEQSLTKEQAEKLSNEEIAAEEAAAAAAAETKN